MIKIKNALTSANKKLHQISVGSSFAAKYKNANIPANDLTNAIKFENSTCLVDINATKKIVFTAANINDNAYKFKAFSANPYNSGFTDDIDTSLVEKINITAIGRIANIIPRRIAVLSNNIIAGMHLSANSIVNIGVIG